LTIFGCALALGGGLPLFRVPGPPPRPELIDYLGHLRNIVSQVFFLDFPKKRKPHFQAVFEGAIFLLWSKVRASARPEATPMQEIAPGS